MVHRLDAIDILLSVALTVCQEDLGMNLNDAENYIRDRLVAISDERRAESQA